MTEEHRRQIANYNEQLRRENMRETGGRQLYTLISTLLDGGAGPAWVTDTVNGIIEIWVDHHPEDDEEVDD